MMTMTVNAGGLSTLTEAARGRLAGSPSQRHAPPDWLVARRRAALARFEKRGVPTTSDEAWRFTDLAPLARTPFLPATAAAAFDDSAFGIPARGTRIVFADGLHQPRLDTAARQPGLRLAPFSQLLREGDGRLESAWTEDRAPGTPFADLNEALASDGAFLDVAPGTVLPEAIHIVHVSHADGPTPTSAHPRHFVRVGERAQVTVVESYASVGRGAHFTNPVTQLDVGAGAVVEHAKINLESTAAYHVGALDVALGRDARLTDHSFSFGGSLVRNDIDVRFAGPGGEATLNGLYLVKGTQHVDHHTFVDHAVPHCTSREFYKGILDGDSRGVFFGKVLIRKDAQKSNAAQSNKNLLISDGALADSTPALEIFADDVKAAHGSTIGQLDKEQIFYLRSRGLDAPMAKSLLTYAFARDIVARVQADPVRGALDELLFHRLPHGDVVREVLHET